MSICLEIVLVQLEPVADPFPAGYSKKAVALYGKMLQFDNIQLRKAKQFFRFKRLWVSPQFIEIAFSSCWKSRDRTIICLSLKEIRIQRDSNNTEHNLGSGCTRSKRI